MQFSRTWKVLEKAVVFQNGYEKFCDFCLEKIVKYAQMDIA